MAHFTRHATTTISHSQQNCPTHVDLQDHPRDTTQTEIPPSITRDTPDPTGQRHGTYHDTITIITNNHTYISEQQSITTTNFNRDHQHRHHCLHTSAIESTSLPLTHQSISLPCHQTTQVITPSSFSTHYPDSSRSTHLPEYYTRTTRNTKQSDTER